MEAVSGGLSAFHALYADLPREGPGEAADVAWACAVAGIGAGAAICDAACGSGGDLAALREAAPGGRSVAFDRHRPFVAAAAARGVEARLVQGVLVTDGSGLPDPVDLGPFDLIWCAGAVYFVGVAEVLTRWRGALRPGGAVAFSHPVTIGPPDAETRAFWDDPDGRFADAAALDADIAAAGWSIIGRRRVSETGWRAYHAGLEARCLLLEREESPDLAAVIASARTEIAAYASLSDRVGYAMRVARPA